MAAASSPAEQGAEQGAEQMINGVRIMALFDAHVRADNFRLDANAERWNLALDSALAHPSFRC